MAETTYRGKLFTRSRTLVLSALHTSKQRYQVRNQRENVPKRHAPEMPTVHTNSTCILLQSLSTLWRSDLTFRAGAQRLQ